MKIQPIRCLSYGRRTKLTAASASEAVMSGRTWRTGVSGLIGRLAPRPTGLEYFRFILVHTHLRQSSFGILGY